MTRFVNYCMCIFHSPTGRGAPSPAQQSEAKGGKGAPSAVADSGESIKKDESVVSAESPNEENMAASRPRY